MLPLFLLAESILRRRSESGGCGVVGCFVVILAIGLVLYLVLRGRQDKPEQLGAAKRAMGSGPIADHTFATPYSKCPTCSASGDKMKQQWDGLRKVTWTCGYCGNTAAVRRCRVISTEREPAAKRWRCKRHRSTSSRLSLSTRTIVSISASPMMNGGPMQMMSRTSPVPPP